MSEIPDQASGAVQARALNIAFDPATVLSELRSVLPESALIRSGPVLAARLTDASGSPPQGQATALVRPTSTAQVSAILAIAHAHRVPVVPQGAMSGLAGGATAVPGALLLDLSAMDSIQRIDRVDQVAVVQAGVVIDDLARAVAAQGLFYPPDPASSDRCTIGGNVATNAGGMRCVKYGVTRDFVRSLQVVLADGTVVTTRPATVKAVAGYDLTGLIVGSEGTLAVVTEVTVALLPAPGPVRGVRATFASVTDALAAANEIMTGSDRPSTLELLDGVVLDAIVANSPGAGLPAGAQAWLLALTDSRVGAQDELAAFGNAFELHGALSIEIAAGPEQVEVLLSARRAFNPAMRALRGASLNEDIAVPRSRLADLIERLGDIASRTGVIIGSAGHVGDGNLHPVIAFDPADHRQVSAAHDAHRQVLALAQELGGTVTGEHGIGLEKLTALEDELIPRVRQLQREIKAVLDPRSILNPGKKI